MRIRLSTRLILSVVLIEAVMLTTLVWNSVRLISSSHAEVLQHHLSEEATLLANLLAPGLAVSDRAILLDALSLAKKEDNIVFVLVQDARGRTMAEIGNVPARIQPDKTLGDAKQSQIFDIVTPITLSKQDLGVLKIGYSTAYVESLISKTRLQNTAIASIELVLSILVTLGVGYFLTRSLRKLEEGAKALSRDELDHRIVLNTHDEMGDLARSFNDLASHLAQTRNALNEEHHALEQKTQQLQSLMDSVNAVIVEAYPLDCQFVYVSRDAENLLGYPLQDWYTPGFLRAHVHPDDLDYFDQQVQAHFTEPGSQSFDFRMFHQDGKVVDIRSINTLNYNEAGILVCRGLMLNVTEQKQNEKRIAYLAEHDALTGLFNRRRFQEELERTLVYTERFKQESALMFIDLDQFKYINDTLGHQAGDEYLCTVARRLADSLRKVDILGRLGGDEFGIILPNTKREEVEHVAQHVLQRLVTDTDSVDRLRAPVTASIGIVLFPAHGTLPGELLAKADAAMYSAKDKGRNTYHIYSESDKQLMAMHAKLQWEQRIRHALDEDLFVLHYQPVFKLNSRTISHYEVLLRMDDGDGGLIPPGAFLDIAERFGMIRDIDRWVLHQAIQVQGESCKSGRPVCLAINLSGRHFGDPQVLEWIRQFVQQSAADPSLLIFEITETAAVENVNQAVRFTDSLHALGCRIALDDFGIGFSSFHYLKHLPVDMIKLDGSFVRQLARDKFDRVFIKSMSDMARGLGITSTAEFIETEEVIAILIELGVDMGQGYHLARPAASFAFPYAPGSVADTRVRAGEDKS
jgi:diguanylate cyclase (GGDEF)-like protein/PAS domain S-box-containing protein